jgi:hypothetical protein
MVVKLHEEAVYGKELVSGIFDYGMPRLLEIPSRCTLVFGVLENIPLKLQVRRRIDTVKTPGIWSS